MFRVLKLLVFLALVGFAGLTGYAYFGDFSPQQSEINQPVTLDVD